MDLATLVGLLGAFGIVVMAILLGGPLSTFIDVPSVLIVVVGSMFVVMMKYSLGQFLGAVKIAIKAFMFKLPKQEDLINEVMEIAQVARKEGVLALEGREFSVPFLGQGIQLMIDGQPPEVVHDILVKERGLRMERHKIGASIFKAISAVAPAMGMIGTLVGLVQMLSNMADPKAIGPAMAVALLTTLYGAVVAFVVAEPISDKLTLRLNEEATVNAMLIDAVGAIQNGTNPRVIGQLLNSYLPPPKRPKEE